MSDTKKFIEELYKKQFPEGEIYFEKPEVDDTKYTAEIENLKALLDTKAEPVEASGEIPAGKLVWKKAKEVFPECDLEATIPYYEWEGTHPLVPEVDDKYIIRSEHLEPLIYSLVTNEKIWLHGHTGTGKTTLVEQFAARLNFPFIAFNCDSEISRSDFIGRETLHNDSGVTISKFIEGILPQAMRQPCFMCLDEISFTLPDISYVIQRVLEGNSLRIAEDGGREVKPHPMFRLFATDNTVGRGDMTGQYPGARAQSTAFLNRFTSWVEVKYLKSHQVKKLIKSKFPSLSEDNLKRLRAYVSEHQKMFENNTVSVAISPRTYLAVANKTVFNGGNLNKAITHTILDGCPEADKQALVELLQRLEIE